jgi:predicted TIM-barrel fold metal-dependent hydrolase
MIIDADTHISAVKFDELAIDADELLRRMDSTIVDKAVVWLKPPYDRDISRENAAVASAVRRFPDRLLGFGWVNPRLGRAHAIAEIRRCLEDYGFHGIKFNGAQDDYQIDAPEVLELVGLVVDSKKVLAFHIGADAPDHTHPFRLGRIAAQFPTATFLMVHMGGAALPPLATAAIETARAHPNIYIVGSAITENEIARAIDALGNDRICFGSDTPFRMMHVQLAMYRALVDPLGQDARDRILGGNIASILGISKQDA